MGVQSGIIIALPAKTIAGFAPRTLVALLGAWAFMVAAALLIAERSMCFGYFGYCKLGHPARAVLTHVRRRAFQRELVTIWLCAV